MRDEGVSTRYAMAFVSRASNWRAGGGGRLRPVGAYDRGCFRFPRARALGCRMTPRCGYAGAPPTAPLRTGRAPRDDGSRNVAIRADQEAGILLRTRRVVVIALDECSAGPDAGPNGAKLECPG